MFTFNWLVIIWGGQGRSSTKVVGGRGRRRSWKNVGHHGLPTEKILVFEWPKTAQMALKVLFFFQHIFKYVQDFLSLSKQFLWIFLFLEGFFFIEIQKIKKG